MMNSDRLPAPNALKAPAQGSIPVAFLISEGAVVIDFSGHRASRTLPRARCLAGLTIDAALEVSPMNGLDRNDRPVLWQSLGIPAYSAWNAQARATISHGPKSNIAVRTRRHDYVKQHP